MLGKVCFFNHLERRLVDGYVDKLWSAPRNSLIYIIFAYWRLQVQLQLHRDPTFTPYAMDHNVLA